MSTPDPARSVPPEPSPWRDVSDAAPEIAIAWRDQSNARCDPYLVWADATTRSDANDVGQSPGIGVLIELEQAEDLPWLISECKLVPNGFEPALGVPTRFVTGLVDRTGLARLVAAVGRQVRRFTLQAARGDISQAQWTAYETIRPDLSKDRLRADDSSVPGDGLAAKFAAASPTLAPAGTSFLGVIDDGLPFAQLAATVRPRVSLWDQGWLPDYLRLGLDGLPATPPIPVTALGTEWLAPWTFPPLRGFFYGRRLKATASPRSDAVAYAAAQYFDPPPTRSHGAGVLGCMAPWTAGRAAAAAEWPAEVSGLAMVQLPSLTVEDTSGGSLAMRVLDGLRFILWQEEVSRPGGAAQPPRPVAANLSYGVHGGPHDGSSMFEGAALELLEQNPQLHLVLPVGNAHRARCHRRGELAPHDATGCRMACKVLPDSGRDTYLEIWVDAAADLRVEILPPGHIQALVVTKNQAKVYVAPLGSDAQPALQFGAIYPASVAQGANGTMVLIAICPTRALGDAGGLGLNQLPRRRIGAPHGVWQITVVNQGAAATRFDAWIERGDAAPDSARGSRQAYFIELTPSDTLNGIATFRHPRLHVVGAMRELDGRLADYSAAGPRRGDALRDQGPDVVVKADRSGHLAGLRTGGFVSGSHSFLNGSSIASAVYAHWLGTSLGSSPPSLPAGPLPPTATAEVSCSAELGPRATDAQRGQARRMVTPPGVGPSRL